MLNMLSCKSDDNYMLCNVDIQYREILKSFLIRCCRLHADFPLGFWGTAWGKDQSGSIAYHMITTEKHSHTAGKKSVSGLLSELNWYAKPYRSGASASVNTYSHWMNSLIELQFLYMHISQINLCYDNGRVKVFFYLIFF